MRFALMVTGPAYGTQQSSSAWQFANALLAEGHELASVFFYREGVYNANQLTARRMTSLTWCVAGNLCMKSMAWSCISA